MINLDTAWTYFLLIIDLIVIVFLLGYVSHSFWYLFKGGWKLFKYIKDYGERTAGGLSK